MANHYSYRGDRKEDPCPICITWTCGVCGFLRRNQRDGRKAQKCPKCGCMKGTSVPMIHYNREQHAEHVAIFEHQTVITPYDPGHIRDLMGLSDVLVPLLNDYRTAYLKAFRSASGTPENTAAINDTNAALNKIESTVRSWVAANPEENGHA